MRSTDHDLINSHGPADAARRFGDLITELATAAGFDLRPGAGGRAALARKTGMSASAVSRMLKGETMPMPHQLEAIARAVGADVRTLLVTAGVISSQSWQKDANSAVTSATSQPLSPDAVADMWGLSDPMIRQMFLGGAQTALRLQRDVDLRASGEAVRRR